MHNGAADMQNTYYASIQPQQAMSADVCSGFCQQWPGIALLLNHEQLSWPADYG